MLVTFISSNIESHLCYALTIIPCIKNNQGGETVIVLVYVDKCLLYFRVVLSVNTLSIIYLLQFNTLLMILS